MLRVFSLLKPLKLSGVIRREEATWRWFLGVAAVPVLLVLFSYRCLPESPRYLSVVGRHEDAGKVCGGSPPLLDLLLLSLPTTHTGYETDCSRLHARTHLERWHYPRRNACKFGALSLVVCTTQCLMFCRVILLCRRF